MADNIGTEIIWYFNSGYTYLEIMELLNTVHDVFVRLVLYSILIAASTVGRYQLCGNILVSVRISVLYYKIIHGMSVTITEIGIKLYKIM